MFYKDEKEKLKYVGTANPKPLLALLAIGIGWVCVHFFGQQIYEIVSWVGGIFLSGVFLLVLKGWISSYRSMAQAKKRQLAEENRERIRRWLATHPNGDTYVDP